MGRWFLATFAFLFAAVGRAADASSYEKIESRFGNNTIRLKSFPANEKSLCDSGTAQHTGWADIGDRHLFFWFHEARKNQRDAPVLIWHQGGPGGSSLHGMLYENGPCISNGPNSTRYNDYSWTEEFNVIYLDQPAGVGYSYMDDPSQESTYPSRTEESALDSIAFIRLFYEAFPHLSQNDLHLSGESFAGRYVPVLASSIIEYNEWVEGDEIIPLRSIMVGNPWLHPPIQLPGMFDVSCWPYRQYPAHLEPTDCAHVLKIQDSCEAMLEACYNGQRDIILCQQPKTLCGELLGIYLNYTRSVYDRRRRHCPGPGDCYPDLTEPLAYLNSDAILRDKLEVPQQSGGRKKGWDMANDLIMERYVSSGDMFISTVPHLKKILDYTRSNKSSRLGAGVHRPVDVMFYAGVADIICNADKVLESLRYVKWEDRTIFRSSPWQELPWNVSSSKRAGRFKSVPNLFFFEMEEAGHMVPHDQPESALSLVRFWLDHIQNGNAYKGDVTFVNQDTTPGQHVI